MEPRCHICGQYTSECNCSKNREERLKKKFKCCEVCGCYTSECSCNKNEVSEKDLERRVEMSFNDTATAERLRYLSQMLTSFGKTTMYFLGRIDADSERWVNEESIAYEPYLKMSEPLHKGDEIIDMMLLVAYCHLRGLSKKETAKEVVDWCEKTPEVYDE